jgi:hypothetical protein
MVTGLWPRAVTVIDMNASSGYLKAMARDGFAGSGVFDCSAARQPATKADRQMPEAALDKKKRQGMGNDVESSEVNGGLATSAKARDQGARRLLDQACR